MITILTGLLASKWGKYILEFGGVALLVFGAYKWAESRGRATQRDSDDQKNTQQIEQARKVAADAKDAAITHAQADAAAADQRVPKPPRTNLPALPLSSSRWPTSARPVRSISARSRTLGCTRM